MVGERERQSAGERKYVVVEHVGRGEEANDKLRTYVLVVKKHAHRNTDQKTGTSSVAVTVKGLQK